MAITLYLVCVITQGWNSTPRSRRIGHTLNKRQAMTQYHANRTTRASTATVLPTKSDSDVMFCLQRYQRLIIDRSLVY